MMTESARAFAQNRQESDDLEDMAHPPGCVHDLQDAVRFQRHVERFNQFPDPCGVDSRDAGQIQHDGAFALIEECTNMTSYCPIERRTKCTFEIEHACAARARPSDHRQGAARSHFPPRHSPSINDRRRSHVKMPCNSCCIRIAVSLGRCNENLT
jgi:hypothetical protein